MRIAIVTDSTAYLPEELKSKYFIEYVPINVLFEGKVYRDGIDLDAKQAYQFLEKNPKDWSTSAPSPGDFLTAFKKCAESGAEAIICFALAKSLSATYSAAVMAKGLAKSEDKLKNIKIEIIDSDSAVTGESLLVLKTYQAIEEGKNFEEIIAIAQKLKEQIKTFLLLDTIRYIYRSGRVPEIASRIGSILPLKPILFIFEKVHFWAATTSREKSKEKVLKYLKENYNPEIPEIGIAYIDTPDEAENLKKEVLSFLPSASIFITEFSPIVGYATGKGTIGLAFATKKRT